MSDQRLFKLSGRLNDTDETHRKLDIYPASPADLVAALVKAVEEGTIEGAERRWECHWASMNYVKCDDLTRRHDPEFCGWRVVVPVREEPNQ